MWLIPITHYNCTILNFRAAHLCKTKELLLKERTIEFSELPQDGKQQTKSSEFGVCYNKVQKIELYIFFWRGIQCLNLKNLFQIAKQQLKHEIKIAPGVKECTIWEIYQRKAGCWQWHKKFAESEIQGDRELENHKNFIERSLRA